MTRLPGTGILTAAALAVSASAALAAPLTYTDLGIIGGSGSYTFDTVGSVHTGTGQTGDVDTELAIWAVDGMLLAQDDDDGPGLFSLITIDLDPGTYFLGISEFNSIFEDDFINSGSGFETDEAATAMLNINDAFAGSIVGLNDSFDQETGFFQVTVANVPVPAALPLLASGMALLGFAGRRRQTPAA